MSRTYAQMVTLLATKLADTQLTSTANGVTFSTGEISNQITWALREFANYLPYERIEEVPLESRTGDATTTTASALVDSTEGQFSSGDVGKWVYNLNDKTWAVITAFVSTAQVTLSKDIFTVGEAYRIYNANCRDERQVNIGSIDDWLWIESAEYPYGHKRNVEILDGRMVLALKYDGTINDTDSAQTSSYKDTPVHFMTIQRLPNLTDYVGVVNNSAGYAVGATAMAIDGMAASAIIPQHALFTIDTVRGTYRVTEEVTLSASGSTGTMKIYPPLIDTVANDDSITFVQSTLRPIDEEVFADMVVAKCNMDKANESVSNRGKDYMTIGSTQMRAVMDRLNRMAQKKTVRYPR